MPHNQPKNGPPRPLDLSQRTAPAGSRTFFHVVALNGCRFQTMNISAIFSPNKFSHIIMQPPLQAHFETPNHAYQGGCTMTHATFYPLAQFVFQRAVLGTLHHQIMKKIELGTVFFFRVPFVGQLCCPMHLNSLIPLRPSFFLFSFIFLTQALVSIPKNSMISDIITLSWTN